MPEKKASDIVGNIRINYDRALQAIRRDNFDYAIELLGDLLKKDPSNFDVRMQLRKAALEKSEKKGGFFKKVLSTAGGGHHLAKAQLALNSNPLEALHEAEKMLVADPKNVTALKISAEAAEKAEFPDTRLRTLVMIHKLAPEDLEANAKLANLYCNLGQPEKAEQIYGVLLTHHPDNQEVMMESKNISARRTMKRGGYEDGNAGGTFRKALKSDEEAMLLEQERRMHKDDETIGNLLAEYERRFETEPENIKLVKDIAELYAQQKNYYRALEYYNHLLEIPDALDSSIERAIAEITVKRYDQVIAELDPTLEDYEVQRADFSAARDQFQFDNLADRVNRYPTDMDARLELGIARFDRGEHAEAIKEFQRVQKFPRLTRKAVLYLARCFAARDMTDLAINALQKAVEAKTELDDDQKELVYTLASIYEDADRMEEAIGYYKQIYEADVGFRDVADKVEKYYGQ
jgi:tetratricopeptide (TPR) repeat protein